MKQVEFVIVGAGAAGIGAARRLVAAGRDVLVLEARDRVGGRAHTVFRGTPLDMGCEWLHSADRNAWREHAERIGAEVDRTEAPWGRSEQDDDGFAEAFARFEQRIANADVASEDAPTAAFLEAGDRHRAKIEAVMGYITGAPLDAVSAQDYARYTDTGHNWRLTEGYGTLISGAAAGLPIALGAPVEAIDATGPRLRIETPRGTIDAARAIVTIPTNLLADGQIRFTPKLLHIRDAAAGLPLGHAEKAFFSLAEPDAFPVEGQVFGRTDTARTGAYHLRPLGRSRIDVFFAGTLAAEFESRADLVAFAQEELASLYGSGVRRTVSPLGASLWGSDPHAHGSYSYAAPGFVRARAVLAGTTEDRIVFAGEAASAHFFSTAHGALESGLAAAEALLGSRA